MRYVDSYSLKLVLLASLTLGVLVNSTKAAFFGSEFRRIASDAGDGDQFGASVAISGNKAVVGAPTNDNPGIDSGAAYLFDTTTGTELFKLTASDASPDSYFGGSVGISGNIAIVGAQPSPEYPTGAAYLFDVSTGSQLLKLTSVDLEPDFFGLTVGISGNKALVGAPYDNHAGELAGAAYLFDVMTGQLVHKLIAADAAYEDAFGYAVALSGNTAIVGAPEVGDSSGAAYLFDVNTGTQLIKLLSSDSTDGDLFGYSVAISGNRAIVGSFTNDEQGVNAGAAYLFDVTTGQQLYKLTAEDAAKHDHFGVSVAISGNWAIVGAGGSPSGASAGSAYIFDVRTGSQILKLTASDPADGDLFGQFVAISGNKAVVGAVGDFNPGIDTDPTGANSGSVYFFVPEPSSRVYGVLLVMGLAIRRRT